MIKIAIIGSREYGDKFEVLAKLQEHIRCNFNAFEVEIISGGARGVDTWAIEWAKLENITTEIIRPINPANKLDYLFRNVEIITKADKIIAFWDGKSKGTKFVLNYAKARNKDITVVNTV